MSKYVERTTGDDPAFYCATYRDKRDDATYLAIQYDSIFSVHIWRSEESDIGTNWVAADRVESPGGTKQKTHLVIVDWIEKNGARS